MDCQAIEFSAQKSEKRIHQAMQVIDSKVVWRILAFALHILGASRKSVAGLLELPEDSVKTTIRTLFRDGFYAFLDRRANNHTAQPLPPIKAVSQITVQRTDSHVVLNFGKELGELAVPIANKLQLRVILLSLQNAHFVSAKKVASILKLTVPHCRELARNLESGDAEQIIDKRRGQSQDFRVGVEQKAEIIQQYAARIIAGRSTASETLANVVSETTQTKISPRTIRWHINKIGLSKIKTTLPELIATLKKTPEDT